VELPSQVARFVAAASIPQTAVAALVPLLAGTEDEVPLPGQGKTLARFSVLASVAGADVTAARVLEPHLDAVAILAEAGVPRTTERATWGVFAAESASELLQADRSDDDWRLNGVKPWCSLGDRLDAALVTAHTGPSTRRLFSVRLQTGNVRSESHAWVARGLSDVDSGPLRFSDVDAEPVGSDDWYLTRSGFEWGGIGVAATWWGGAVPLCTAITASVRAKAADSALQNRVGALWQSMFVARTVIERAAALIDDGTRSRDEWAVIAHAVRGATAMAVDEALDAVRDILGPAALCTDENIARRAADLQTYTAQYHRLRDPASIGRRVLEDEVTW
jgi:alkylation response protein AidB-like acyl-CoA dehydrogenase